MLKLIQQFTVVLTDCKYNGFNNNDEKGVTYAMKSAWAYSANLQSGEKLSLMVSVLQHKIQI